MLEKLGYVADYEGRSVNSHVLVLIRQNIKMFEAEHGVIEGTIRAISNADMLIIGGTSLVVYPAAGFIDYFQGKYLVVINKSETGRAVRADLTISAPIGQIMGGIEVRQHL